MTGDVSPRTPMTTSRNAEHLPSIMAAPRWSCGGSQTTHPRWVTLPSVMWPLLGAIRGVNSLIAYLSFFTDPLSNFRAFPPLSESPGVRNDLYDDLRKDL